MNAVKRLLAVGAAIGLTVAGSMAAYAGEWKFDDTGWWYQNDDGSYPTDKWEWIVQELTSGLAYCYYFDSNGYILKDTTTPDGYQVNPDGVWIENGEIQKKFLDAEEINKFRNELEQKKQERDEASVQDAKDALYDAEDMSFYYRGQAVFDYLEALGFNTTGLSISRDEGVRYTSELMLGGNGNSMYNLLKYNSQNVMKKIAEYVSGKSYLDEDGEKADNLITAVEEYLNR